MALINNNKGHIWQRTPDGQIDLKAQTWYDGKTHSGPSCVQCGYTFCYICMDEPASICPGPVPSEPMDPGIGVV